MGQDRPQATLTRASRSADRSDDSLQDHATEIATYSAPGLDQHPAGAAAVALAMPGLAVGAGPLLREISGGADPLGGNPIPDGVLSALRRRKGGGQPLTPGVATDIGQQLGPAASAARIHTDGEADHIARSVQSVAFTYGSDVYFTQGAYAPNSQSGQRLLAHELSHVRQGATGSSGGGAIVGAANDPAEHEADRSADQVLGALRRQAARQVTPACDHAGHDGGGAAHSHAGHLAASTLARTATETVRRVYTEQERPGILQLAQLENSQERLAALEALNWSSADTIQLAQQQPPPSYAEMGTVMARLTAAQFAAIQPMCASWADVLAVAATAWPAADLARYAGVLPRPSVAQLQTVAGFFSPAEVDGLMPICAGWVDLVTLAGSAWLAADLARVAAVVPRPSALQLQTVTAFFTAAQVAAIMTVCSGWPDLTTLAGSAWAAADIAEVAGNEPRPTTVQLQSVVSRFTADQLWELIETEGFAWADLAGLANAAAPAVQSPAITLRDALSACDALVADEVAALGEAGLNVTPARYKALLIGTNSLADTDYRQLMDYLQDARWFSICFDTAQRLFEDLGNVAANASGGARDAKYALAQQQIRSALLVNHLNGASGGGQPVIFNIHIGGHGFSLTVIGGQVYQLEAFASQAARPNEDPSVLANGEDLDMSLLTSIGANRSYPINTVTAAITDMTSNNAGHRGRGANAMGWNPGPCGFLDADDNVTDPMAIWWESASLHSNAQIVVNVAKRIQRQRVQIREKLGILDDDEDD